MQTLQQFGQNYPRIVIDISPVYAVFANYISNPTIAKFVLSDEQIFQLIDKLIRESDTVTHIYLKQLMIGVDVDNLFGVYTPEMKSDIDNLYIQAGMVLRDVLYYYGLINSVESHLLNTGYTESFTYVLEHISRDAAILVKFGN